MLDIDLLDRIRQKDSDAFLELTERYGWPVYSVIRENTEDHVLADKIYNDTMNAFYHSICDSAAEDPMEAILCGYASLISEKQLNTDRAGPNFKFPTKEYTPPEIHLFASGPSGDVAEFTKRKKIRFLYLLGIMITFGIIAAVIWGITGLLMEMGFIPYVDLGYSWFNANILQLF